MYCKVIREEAPRNGSSRIRFRSAAVWVVNHKVVEGVRERDRKICQSNVVGDRTTSCRLMKAYEAPAASPTEYWRGRRSALIGGQIAGRWLLSVPLRSPAGRGIDAAGRAHGNAVFMTGHRRAFNRRSRSRRRPSRPPSSWNVFQAGNGLPFFAVFCCADLL